MEQYLIDTNIISDYFSAALPPLGIDLLNAVIDDIPKLSVITKIELLCWNTSNQIKNSVKSLINDSIIFDISDDVIDDCVKLRTTKRIKTPDAIIAATALVHNFIIITNNEKDFANIKGLKFINPHKL